MGSNETIFYLHNEKDFIALVDRYTRNIISFVEPVTIIEKGEILERGFKLEENENYLIYENGVSKYCYIKNEELVPL